MRIVVTGYMVRLPTAGNVLAYLQYVMGFLRLGCEVLYLEESGWPEACYDVRRRRYGDDPSTGLEIVQGMRARLAPRARLAYMDRATGRCWGEPWPEIKAALARADLLVNVGGVCWLPEFRRAARLAFVDMDPFFTQLGRFGQEGLRDHHVHLSYGLGLRRALPAAISAGIDWLPLLPPVICDLWSARGADAASAAGAFTTVANWSAYGSISHGGETYGQKDREFLRFIELPHRTSQSLELALAGADRSVVERFTAAGWRIRSAEELSGDLDAYRAYIAASKGEFSVAKNGYVKARTGWVSDRSACYLAAGRPVVVQETGVSEELPTGRGLVTFRTLAEAAEGLERVARDGAAHRTAALRLAQEHFAHDVVLTGLLRRCDLALA